jgi:hypothetical protein
MKYYRVRLRAKPWDGDNDAQITEVEVTAETLRTVTVDGVTVPRESLKGNYYADRGAAHDALVLAQASRLLYLSASIDKARERLKEIQAKG